MALGQLTWAGDQPSSPAELKQWFHTDVVQPAVSQKTMFYQMAKKVQIEGESFVVPSRSRADHSLSMLRSGENTPFQLEKISYSGRRGVAELQGVAVEISETMINRNRGLFDVKADHMQHLRERLAGKLEQLCASALDEVNLDYIPTGVADQVVETSGTVSDAATSNINLYHIQNLSLLARDTYAIEKVPGMNSYVGFFRGNAYFALANDSRYEARYEGVPESLKGNVIKDIDGIKLMEVNDDDIIDDSLGASNNISEGYILGKDALCAGLVQPLELFVDFNKLWANHAGTKNYMWIKGDLKIIAPRISATKYEVSSIHITSSV